jgi:ABC-type multidrug transport system ATPase subunit
MKLKVNKISFENFRGIKKVENLEFKDVNFFIGNNGSGKSTLLAVISRVIPILRDDKDIFRDADFLFYEKEKAYDIRINYEIEVDDEKYFIEVISQRKNIGKNRSFLNDQFEVVQEIKIYNSKKEKVDILTLIGKSKLKQKIVRHGWMGSRVAPVYMGEKGKISHAAISEGEEWGFFDAYRARQLEVVKNSDLAKNVKETHPKLFENIKEFVHSFLGKELYKEISLGFSDQLVFERTNGIFEPWAGLSGGEQSTFNLAMAIEFEKNSQSNFVFFEEPENNLHPVLISQFLEKVEPYFTHAQIFITTHSPYSFKDYLSKALYKDRLNILISKEEYGSIKLENYIKKIIPYMTSWGEINYIAYDLPTNEFHDELYGYLQEKNKKYKEKKIECFFKKNKLLQNKQWTREENGKVQTPNNVTLQTFIRNKLHHPENKTMQNDNFTPDELRQSINEMINLL